MVILKFIIAALCVLFARRAATPCHCCGDPLDANSLADADGRLVCAMCWDAGYGYRAGGGQ